MLVVPAELGRARHSGLAMVCFTIRSKFSGGVALDWKISWLLRAYKSRT